MMRGQLAITALLAIGCRLGPDFHRPRTAAMGKWREPAGAGAPDPRWWQTFGDAQLTDLVERAVAGNNDLAQAEARVRQARAARGIVVGGLLPAVDLTGSAATVKLPAGDTSLEEYFSYVLLDFAMVDADLEDQALSRLAHLASAFGLEETFARIARKELRLSASSYAELKARGATIEEKGVTA